MTITDALTVCHGGAVPGQPWLDDVVAVDPEHVKMDEAAWQKDIEFIKAMIHYEVDVDLFGLEEARRQLMSVDPQAAFALGFLSEAKALIKK